MTPTLEVTGQDSNLSFRRRIVTGLVCAVLYPIIAFIPWGGGLPFAIVVALFSGIATSELYRAVRRQGADPTTLLGYIACILFNLAAWRRAGAMLDTYLPALLVILVIIGLLIELVKRRLHPTSNLGTTLLGAIYVAWLSSFVTLLHGTATTLIKVPFPATTTGEWLLIYVSLMTWGADTAALFTGRLLGRHKLAPFISPSKTWEGVIGGLVVSCSVGLAMGQWLHFPLVYGLIFGVLMSVFGVLGDLCASVLKRDLGLKDFGGLLPGHGGVLDRIDSIILTAPVAYYFVALVERLH